MLMPNKPFDFIAAPWWFASVEVRLFGHEDIIEHSSAGSREGILHERHDWRKSLGQWIASAVKLLRSCLSQSHAKDWQSFLVRWTSAFLWLFCWQLHSTPKVFWIHCAAHAETLPAKEIRWCKVEDGAMRCSTHFTSDIPRWSPMGFEWKSSPSLVPSSIRTNAKAFHPLNGCKSLADTSACAMMGTAMVDMATPLHCPCLSPSSRPYANA